MFDYGWKSKSRTYESLRKKICDIRDIGVFDLAFAHTKFGLVRSRGAELRGPGGELVHFYDGGDRVHI